MGRRSERISTLWATGQVLPRVQRGDRYTRASRPHPAKMWPWTARHAIAAYSQPGDWVCDPMCGIGTALVEAMALGRSAIGIDCESDWVAAAAGNVHLARGLHATTAVEGIVKLGDARRLRVHLPKRLRGRIDLILTSPPYGAATHGRAYTRRETGGAVAKTDYLYSRGDLAPAQLARSSLDDLLEGLRSIFTACRHVLGPGGRLVIACRPFTSQGELVDFPAALHDLCTEIGFRPLARTVALLAEWETESRHLRPIHSFFNLHNTRAAIERGRPALLRTHEDVLAFVKGTGR